MPFPLYLLGLAVFAQSTSEFMLAGLAPDIARDLGVSVPTAGTLTSAFAVGMIVGAPLTALLGRRRPGRQSLLVFLGVFLAVHVVGALTGDFSVLLATRVLAALANAGFLAVGLTAATAMVAPDAKGRATAVLLGGTTLACVVGVPAGAALGQLLGWRSAFWAVALMSAPALLAVARSVPRGPADTAGPGPDARAELRALRRPRLRSVLCLAALVNGATFCTFTYLAPLVTEVCGLEARWVPAVLALFGAGAFAGVTAAGRLADRGARAVLPAAGAALLAGWAALAVAAGQPAAAVALVPVLGLLAFGVGSTLVTRVLYEAVDAPSLGGAFATSALNVGAALGPALGGAALDGGLGHRSPVWVSALLMAVAGLVARGSARRRERSA
ncbi:MULTISPECIES: Cmx/CmrA family chloramphenicol efflux MFS transporter [Streptomyces]|uniref:MFS transporter n=1 Tax=Streptomyces bangladeshensis TaxID=295352 RepID=A0ABP5NPW6_9ACTN|nr:Cmx/CmrA family chloramphenicol efflux MFS transporter [Streptomyces sp. EAS-AB2608]MYU27238.1 Cmx/CmrA family chloramphenicol efflux MFS transporter [Streptomyces sp. SID7810]BCM72588.1 putative permease of the major facilitator superfamily [Streptomyces sp. EAS-AB2608]CUW26081.1 Inner membrane transport protein YdhP [Streptomyces reticuli]